MPFGLIGIQIDLSKCWVYESVSSISRDCCNCHACDWVGVLCGGVMLWIYTRGFNRRPDRSFGTWHVGEGRPNIGHERVMTFQAEGHELELIMLALERSNPVNEHGEVTLRCDLFHESEE
jgi:hypothetical protein